MTATMVKGDFKLLDLIECSEPGNAERLAAIARGRIHYVDTWNTWIVYRDGKWEVDGGGVGLQEFAKMVPQSIFTMAETIKPVAKEGDITEEDAEAAAWYKAHITHARKSNTEPSITRMVKLARGLPGMRITSDDLDSKPHLLNLHNGTFDFSTTEFKAHDPGDLITKKANAWYDPTATCPNWLRYMEQWQPDHGVQRFLQSITGSGLIGVPVQNLFVNVGPGRNGKSTFYKTIQLIIGEYAGTAPEDMLVDSRFRVHDEEKARLRGLRFLVAQETSVGDRLDESGIKNMTGGDSIHARHLYGRPFDFKPTHTAFLHTNYEPQIRGTDPAIWNRVVKIPWDTYIKEDQRDFTIDDKLEAERSGILNWLILGCMDWLKHGLKKPKVISDATEGYRVEQDSIGRFVDDCLDAMVKDAADLAPVDYIPASTLRKHYEAWCLQEGTKPWVSQSVGKELRRIGWVSGQTRVGKIIIRTWQPQTLRYTVSSKEPSTSTLITLVTDVPSSLYLNHVERSKEEEEESNREVKYARVVTSNTSGTEPPEPTEAEREEDHREWLRDHGYPVPPTDAEIEAFQEERYADMRSRETPDWVE